MRPWPVGDSIAYSGGCGLSQDAPKLLLLMVGADVWPLPIVATPVIFHTLQAIVYSMPTRLSSYL